MDDYKEFLTLVPGTISGYPIIQSIISGYF